MSTLLELLLFLLSVTGGHVEIKHVDFVPSYYGHDEDGGARVDCRANREEGCTILLSTTVYDRDAGQAYIDGEWTPEGRAYAEVLTHELAHVWDYMDDGSVDGSPGHQEHVFPDNTLGRYCAQNAVERYACAVVETLSLANVQEQPVTVAEHARVRPVLDLRPR